MSESISAEVTVIAPSLVGVWVHDPTDASGTIAAYPYAEGRTEKIIPQAAIIDIVGRENALIEYGESTFVGLTLTALVPFDEHHDAAVQWWRDAVDNRRTICYRDNRGRLYYVGLPAGVSPVDGRIGTSFALELRRVDFDEAVA